MPPKKKAAVQKGNTNAAKGRESEPINSASYAAVARRGLVATGPPAHAAEETREVYEGGRNNHQVPPGKSTPATLTIFLPHLFHAVASTNRKKSRPSVRESQVMNGSQPTIQTQQKRHAAGDWAVQVTLNKSDGDHETCQGKQAEARKKQMEKRPPSDHRISSSSDQPPPRKIQKPRGPSQRLSVANTLSASQPSATAALVTSPADAPTPPTAAKISRQVKVAENHSKNQKKFRKMKKQK